MNMDWIKKYYEMGLYDTSDLQLLVDAGFLTEEERKEIEGEGK